jgi:hypothetical protein
MLNAFDIPDRVVSLKIHLWEHCVKPPKRSPSISVELEIYRSSLRGAEADLITRKSIATILYSTRQICPFPMAIFTSSVSSLSDQKAEGRLTFKSITHETGVPDCY